MKAGLRFLGLWSTLLACVVTLAACESCKTPSTPDAGTATEARPPDARMERAIRSAQVSMSPRVYPTTVGLPVVPEDACTRITCSRGTANRPKG